MNSDFVDLLRLFNRFRVKYLVIGGYAVIKYTVPRYTGDIDLLIEASSENSRKVFKALEQFGAPLDRYSAEDFAHPGFFYQMGMPPVRVDVLMSIKGVKFEDAWKRRCDACVDRIKVHFLSREDLIRSKQAAGRLKDKLDLEALGALPTGKKSGKRPGL